MNPMTAITSDHGAGPDSLPVLVLLHAFPLDSSMWRRLVPHLQQQWNVVPLDLPGLGRSPVPDRPPSMRAVAEHVLDRLDELGLELMTVFGVSTGGYAALQIADLAPARCAALVLGSTTTRIGPPDEPDDRRAHAAELERSGSTEVVAVSAREGLGATARREQPDLEPRLGDLIARADPRGVAWMARAIASRTDTTAVLEEFAGPVQLLFGDEDGATPPTVAAQLHAARGEGPTRLDVLGGVGHLAALEQPRRVASCLQWVRGRV